MNKSVQQWTTFIVLTVTAMSMAVILAIYLKLAFIKYQSPDPQAILVLGGNYNRESLAARLAAQQTQLEVWISSGMPPTKANDIFLAQNVTLSRIKLDYKATDTVTNFTTLVSQLQDNNIQHIYLITSDFHMPRATAIAFWILGSRGIAYTPLTVPSNQPPEPHHKILRDIARSWLWLLTGRTGSSLDPNPPVRSS